MKTPVVLSENITNNKNQIDIFLSKESIDNVNLINKNYIQRNYKIPLKHASEQYYEVLLRVF